MLVAEQRRLVTLTGSGGSGKTRLAVEVARGLVEEFQGAVWFVSLADLSDARLIVESVRDALRLPRSPSMDPLEQVVAALGRQPALLLLDNFEHLLIHGAALVRDLLERVETLTVLVTSRQRLDLAGERELVVLPLPIPRAADSVEELIRCESVQIFTDRAQAVRSEFEVTSANARAVAELCRRLEGIPLAVELAAARAQVLTPAQMLAQIADRFDLLVSRERDVPTRHRTLRAALDWSYQLLSPELQRLFARLSVFRGGWTAEATEAVCEEPKALDYLEVLRECSLVVAEEQTQEMRFHMLETLREYAREQLSPEERVVLEQRHAAHFLALAEQAMPELLGPKQGIWLARLEQEHDNLRSALGELETKHTELLQAALGGTAVSTEWQESPADVARLAKWGQIVEQLVRAYRYMGRGEAAQGVLQSYLSLCQRHGYAQGIARGCTLMGVFLDLNVGRVPSRSLYEQAIAVCEAHGLRDWIAYPQVYLARHLACASDDLEQAEALARACLFPAEARQDKLVLQHAYLALMWVAFRRGDWAALKKVFQASLSAGGPYRIRVPVLLDAIEQSCHRAGDDATFVALCREMAQGYARAGLTPPLEQWYLVPASPRPEPGEPMIREDFDAPGWHTALTWVDATGLTRVDRSTRPGWLSESEVESLHSQPEVRREQSSLP
jgi:predicted ATPase